MDPRQRSPEPADGDERSVLLGWLAFHRDALAVKCNGLSDGRLVERSAPPSPLSLLGLVRHMTEMERVYGHWGLGPPTTELTFVWGDYTDGGPEWDVDCDASMVADSMAAWAHERAAVDELIASHTSLTDVGGNGYSMRWNLTKLTGEYARHNGHADLIRERIDGQTGD